MTIYRRNGLPWLVTLVCAASMMSISSLSAHGVTQISRYATVNNVASVAQQDPLASVMQVKFPNTVNSVGDAISYMLRYSGFSLVSTSKMTKPVKEMMKLPLPLVDRSLGPIQLKDALVVLAGVKVFDLHVDPLHRTVNFDLKRSAKRYLR